MPDLNSLTIFLPLLPLVIVLAVMIWWRWYSLDNASLKIRDSLVRNLGLPHRNLIALLLGLITALLPLTSGIWTLRWASWILLGSLALLPLLILVRPNAEKEMDRFTWGLLVVVILGFGLGALIYRAHPWWVWLWNQYRRINEPHELVLEALFLLGVMLGVFVVRNWSKEQEAFQKSLTGILSGTFVATVLGEVLTGLTPLSALAYYALGFTISATLNLLFAARLTANYINKRSVTSRAVLEFLYGRERVKEIDGYFLRNFEEDPDYAKRFLKDTLLKFRELVQQEFADRLDSKIARMPGTDSEKCTELKSEQATKKQLLQKLKDLPTDPNQEAEKKRIEADIKKTTESILTLERQIAQSYCYELVAIECDPGSKEDEPSAAAVMEREHSVIYKRIHAKSSTVSPEESRMKAEMIRVGVAIRRQDVLEYVVAPGQYLGSFPYFGSVAGLSVIVRQTIVMDRDRAKKFRSKDYRDGICPKDIEQWRGLDEIDFLSYVSIPIVSRLGRSTENPLGVVNIDTKLFVTRCRLEGEDVDKTKGLFRTRLTPKQLNEYAANLYEQEDEDVKYIEKLTKIIEPVVELYAKCCIGAP